LETDELFFTRSGFSRADAVDVLENVLAGADDGELFFEHVQFESLAFDDGNLKSASRNTSQGFGLRAVFGEAVGLAHASELSPEALRRAADSVSAVRAGYSGSVDAAPPNTNSAMYTSDNPLAATPFDRKVDLLAEIDAYARGKDPRVKQVMVSLAGQWQAVSILRQNGAAYADIRPLVRMNVSVVVEQDARMETGSFGTGGRVAYDRYLTPESWRHAVDEALRQAIVNLESVSAPAGEMTVVLGPGWPGILLHEAIGHGLEGDFNRKRTSAFSGLMGQRIASPGVTVVDDGTLTDRRGSLTVDDEGTPSERTVLIEDGILSGFIQDRMNAG
jgi:TldD protein